MPLGQNRGHCEATCDHNPGQCRLQVMASAGGALALAAAPLLPAVAGAASPTVDPGRGAATTRRLGARWRIVWVGVVVAEVVQIV